MFKHRIFSLIFPFVFVILIYICFRCLLPRNDPPTLNKSPNRIVSLAPNITETLYALGLGDVIVGVTSYCGWPEEARKKPRVAEYEQLNLEYIALQKPDLVVLPANRLQYRPVIERLGIPVLWLGTLNLPNYLQSMEELGRNIGKDREASELRQKFASAISSVKRRVEGHERPSALFAVDRIIDVDGDIQEVMAVGMNGFYGDILKYAGAENIYKGDLPYPRISRESLCHLDPEFIIDIVRDYENPAYVRKLWEKFVELRAIREGKLILLCEGVDSVPGPRSIGTMQKLARAFFPDN